MDKADKVYYKLVKTARMPAMTLEDVKTYAKKRKQAQEKKIINHSTEPGDARLGETSDDKIGGTPEMEDKRLVCDGCNLDRHYWFNKPSVFEFGF